MSSKAWPKTSLPDGWNHPRMTVVKEVGDQSVEASATRDEDWGLSGYIIWMQRGIPSTMSHSSGAMSHEANP